MIIKGPILLRNIIIRSVFFNFSSERYRGKLIDRGKIDTFYDQFWSVESSELHTVKAYRPANQRKAELICFDGVPRMSTVIQIYKYLINKVSRR